MKNLVNQFIKHMLNYRLLREELFSWALGLSVVCQQELTSEKLRKEKVWEIPAHSYFMKLQRVKMATKTLNSKWLQNNSCLEMVCTSSRALRKNQFILRTDCQVHLRLILIQWSLKMQMTTHSSHTSNGSLTLRQKQNFLKKLTMRSPCLLLIRLHWEIWSVNSKLMWEFYKLLLPPSLPSSRSRIIKTGKHSWEPSHSERLLVLPMSSTLKMEEPIGTVLIAKVTSECTTGTQWAMAETGVDPEHLPVIWWYW